MISAFFINRPVLATIISIIIILAGLAAMRALPVAQYPQIIPPQVSVQASYPGANAQVVADTVAAPLEQKINGVEDMIYMNSTSDNNGSLQLYVTFNIGTNPDLASVNVNNRIQAALAQLPVEVRRNGVTVQKSSNVLLEVISMYSPNAEYDTILISNYALLNVVEQLKRIEGVGDASIFGSKDYSMRIWLKPDKLALYGLTSSDVVSAVLDQNSQFAAGQFGSEPMSHAPSFTYSIMTKGRLITKEEFQEIILKADKKGNTLRLKDVARVELGAVNYNLAANYNSKPAIGIGIYLQPDANALSTSAAISKKMKEISASFPSGLEYAIPFDTTNFVRISIKEVTKTFFEALLLVIAVIFLFLQNARATLIPVVVVPISIIGTFAGIYLLGFSVNLLTLFGMVLSIGIVVDDAIVVLENVERIMQTEKLPAKAATLKAMEEVSGPIVAIVLALCAVFIPVGFMTGLTGQMYKQFAITIAISVVISGFVALTLSPVMCMLILKESELPKTASKRNNKYLNIIQKGFRKFNDIFAKTVEKYIQGVKLILEKPILAIIGFLIMILISIVLFIRIPSSLLPEEDQGYLVGILKLMPGSALNRTVEAMEESNKNLLSNPAVENIISFAGLDIFTRALKTDTGVTFMVLKDWEKRNSRSENSHVLARKFIGMNSSIKEAFFLAFNPPPITGISITGGFEMYLQNHGSDDTNTFFEVAHKFLAEAKKRPELTNMQLLMYSDVPQYYVDLDRTKCKSLKVDISSVYTAMQTTFGSYYINDFNLFGRTYHVSLQSESQFREKPEDLKYVYVRSEDNKLIPLNALIKVRRIVAPDIVERFNIFPAAKIVGNAAPGYSSGQAIAAIEDTGRQFLTKDYSIGWISSAYQEKLASAAGKIAFIFGIVMVFLILAGLYESWLLPFAVIAIVPFAFFGAALAVWLRGLHNDLYFQVGILTLIGLSAKNAILIVEFAVLLQRQGLSIVQASIEAARLRFRPIVMTSLAFILGCIPMAISTGASSGSRHAIGTGVIGGMLAATFLATFFVPLFFTIVMTWSQKLSKKKVILTHQKV